MLKTLTGIKFMNADVCYTNIVLKMPLASPASFTILLIAWIYKTYAFAFARFLDFCCYIAISDMWKEAIPV